MTTLRWQCICFESTDPQTVARFWEQALGWRRTHDSPEEVVLEPPAGSPEDGVSPDILFLRVPESKTVKNRRTSTCVRRTRRRSWPGWKHWVPGAATSDREMT